MTGGWFDPAVQTASGSRARGSNDANPRVSELLGEQWLGMFEEDAAESRVSTPYGEEDGNTSDWEFDQPADGEPLPPCPGLGTWDLCTAPEALMLPPTDELPAPADGVVFIGDNWADCEQELVRRAIGMLRDNYAIVQWAVCMATGRRQSTDCLRRKIFGEGRDVRFRKDYDNPPGQPCSVWASSYSPSQVVRFCSQGVAGPGDTALRYFDVAASFFCYGPDEGLELSQPMCAVVFQASLILHELTHICGYWGTNEDQCACSRSYLVQAHFFSVMRDRYPPVWGTEFCTGQLASKLDPSRGCAAELGSRSIRLELGPATGDGLQSDHTHAGEPGPDAPGPTGHVPLPGLDDLVVPVTPNDSETILILDGVSL